MLNVENDREALVDVEPTEGPLLEISMGEVIGAVASTQCGKATGPSGIGAEMFKALGEEGTEWLHGLLNKIWKDELIPSEWKRSVMVPLFR